MPVESEAANFSFASGNKKITGIRAILTSLATKKPSKSNPRIFYPNAACFAEHPSQLAARDHPPSRGKNIGAKCCVKQKQVINAQSNRENPRLYGDSHPVPQPSIYMPSSPVR
jgi:hypothetical protein